MRCALESLAGRVIRGLGLRHLVETMGVDPLGPCRRLGALLGRRSGNPLPLVEPDLAHRECQPGGHCQSLEPILLTSRSVRPLSDESRSKICTNRPERLAPARARRDRARAIIT